MNPRIPTTFGSIPGGNLTVPAPLTTATRLDLETDLAQRTSGLLYFVYQKAWGAVPAVVAVRGEAPPIAPTGSNPLYAYAIGWAMDLAGYPAASPPVVTDFDIAAIDAAKYQTVADLAEYRIIANALGNYIQPDESGGGRSQSWGSLRAQFLTRLGQLESPYKPYLKASQYQLGFGSIRLPIASRPNNLYPGGVL